MPGRLPLATVRGGESGPLILFLHGIGTSATLWLRLAAELAGEYRWIAPDLRGYGDSPDPAGAPALEDIVEDVAATIGEEPAGAHVVGVSFGALTALALARRYPDRVRSLTLADATLGKGAAPAEERERWIAMRAGIANDLGRAIPERARAVTSASVDAATLREIEDGMRRVRPAGYRAIAAIIAATDARPWLPGITQPTLVLCGAEDRIVGVSLSASIAQTIPAARYLVLAGAGHAPQVEAPLAFAHALRAFYSEIS